MKIFLDEMDEKCTPALSFCCRGSFLKHHLFFFNLRAGNQDECRMAFIDAEAVIAYCPFCGAKIQFLRNDAGREG